MTDHDVDRLRMRAGMPVLDRGDGELQLGTDPRWALRLAGLDAGEVAWLRELALRRHTSPAAAAARHGVGAARQDEIVRVLRLGGFLQPGPAVRAGAVVAAADGAADAPALGALRPDGAGRATLAARARAAVAVDGLGRLGAQVALHLATAGVGTLVLADTSPVQTTDVGLGAFARADVGRPRAGAMAEVLRRAAPGVRVQADGTVDVVVLVETHARRPGRCARLMGQGVAHLSVTVREADVVVGPFVLPGRTACARCADLTLADDDPAWPAMAAQLRADAVHLPQETTLVASAAAFAGAQVLAHLDGMRPAAAGAVVELALPHALPRVRELAPHPRCGCVTLTRPGAAGAA